MVRTYPPLLAHSAAPHGTPYRAALTALADRLVCDPDRLLRGCVAAAPALLVQPAAAVEACCAELSSSWQLQAEQLVEVVEAQPSLLLQSPGACKVTHLHTHMTHTHMTHTHRTQTHMTHTQWWLW